MEWNSQLTSFILLASFTRTLRLAFNFFRTLCHLHFRWCCRRTRLRTQTFCRSFCPFSGSTYPSILTKSAYKLNFSESQQFLLSFSPTIAPKFIEFDRWPPYLHFHKSTLLHLDRSYHMSDSYMQRVGVNVAEWCHFWRFCSNQYRVLTKKPDCQLMRSWHY